MTPYPTTISSAILRGLPIFSLTATATASATVTDLIHENSLIAYPVRAVLYLQLVVEGGAAGRGPSSPEPPSMSLDGSSHVSSMMIEEQETGDTRV